MRHNAPGNERFGQNVLCAGPDPIAREPAPDVDFMPPSAPSFSVLHLDKGKRHTKSPIESFRDCWLDIDAAFPA
jgi:hypothetical protein